MKLSVCVRKRPLFQKENIAGEIDCVSSNNPKIVIHQCNLKVDGITRYIENYEFVFDNSFNERENNRDVYKNTI